MLAQGSVRERLYPTRVEPSRPDGSGYGLLCGRDGAGSTLVGLLDLALSGALSCPPLYLYLLPDAPPPAALHEGADARWTKWPAQKLVAVPLAPAEKLDTVLGRVDCPALCDVLKAALTLGVVCPVNSAAIQGRGHQGAGGR